MSQGKFSQPRSGKAAPRRSDRPPEPKRRSLREDATLSSILSDDPFPPKNVSAPGGELEDWMRQLNLDATPEEEDFPVEEEAPAEAAPDLSSMPPVYNQEIQSSRLPYHPGALREPEEWDDDEEAEEEPVTFTERLMDFVDGHRRGVLVGLCVSAAVLLVSIVLIIFFSVGGTTNDPYGNRILNNVMVAGVNVGGMTRSEAVTAVKRATVNTFTKQDMVVQFSDETLALSPKKTGAKLDVSAAVDAAFSYGRTGTKSEQQKDYQNSLTGNHTIGLLPYLELDKQYIQQALNEYAGKYTGQFTQSSYTLEGEKPDLSAEGFDENTPCQTLVLTLGTPGFGLDIQELYAKILDAYSMNVFLVEVGDVPENAEPDPLDLDAIYGELYVAPVDSSIDPNTYEIVAGTYGYGFDLEKAKALLAGCQYGDTLRISMEYIAPAESEDILFRDVLGSCETPHTSNENRNTNLRIVCQTLNGMILEPGETFSYNEALGQRTAEKGYKMAPAYSGQDLKDSLGGGICQGSSTLYYCALLADMQIVERVNHGFPASYIDLGMDATVSWGSPDLKFKNTSEFPVKIQAEVSGGYMKMKILGTDTRDYYIKMEYEITGTSEPETIYEEHREGEGYTDGQVLQSGKSAVYVKSYKLKYDKETGKLLSKDFETRSHYQSKNEIVVRIIKDETKPTETQPTETTTEATESTTQAAESTTQATESTTQATESTTQATESTTQATESTTQATESTTQATESTTQATESSSQDDGSGTE